VLAQVITLPAFDMLYLGPDAEPTGLYRQRVDFPGAGLIVGGGLGTCRLNKSLARLECSLGISFAEMACTLVLTHLRDTTVYSSPIVRYVEPEARFHIVVGLRLNILAPEGATIETWDGRTIPLAIQDGTGIVDPPIDAVRLFSPSGAPLHLPRVVEWRGFLGGHSLPSSQAMRQTLEGSPETHLGIANWLADIFAIGSLPIPAWPYRVGSEPEAPYGYMLGAMTAGFGASA